MKALKKIIDLICNTVNIQMLFLGALVILPFLFLCLFNHPSADDYCNTNLTLDMGIGNANIYLYKTWTGRYSSTLLLTINPLIFHSFWGYKMISFFIIAITIGVNFLLISMIINSSPLMIKMCLTVLLTIIYFLDVPNSIQAFYWMASTLSYQLSGCLIILWIYFFIKHQSSSKSNSPFYYTLVIMFLSIVIIGMNEISMVILDCFVLAVLLFRIYQKKYYDYSYYLIFSAMLIASYFSFIAPGNAIRSQFFEGNHNLLKSLIGSFYNISTFFRTFFMNLIFLAFFVIALLDNKIVAEIKKRILPGNPLMVLSMLVTLLFISFFPGWWSMGGTVPDRTLGHIYHIFLIGWLYFIFSSYCWFINFELTINKYVILTVWSLFLIITISNKNLKTAYEDLISGKASRYDHDMKKRYELIKASTENDLLVPAIENPPVSIYNFDISENKNEWINECYSHYFNKESIQKEK
jgi:hypothetical protein